ncbi:hypothetical protein QOZ80_1BG0057320 [Eleusine coracana subsp. coracana]|nr:hypothetical protein QOZ80_1BG0057320 [Eleusine coracana subsp. coracana]
MDTQRNHRLLLVCSWLFIIINSSARRAAASFLHPIVLLPGFGCSQLDARLTDEYAPPPAAPACGARKGTGWFRLWENHTASRDPDLVPCYADQLRVVYDPLAGDYRDAPGVETRVVSFGTTRGFGSDDPAQKLVMSDFIYSSFHFSARIQYIIACFRFVRNQCMEKLVKALTSVGYTEGENLFGAPYDFRHAPAPPGQASSHFSRFASSLRVLVERASEKNRNVPVILVTHSLGGPNAIEFLNRTPLLWRRRFVKHLVMLAGSGGGSVPTLQILAAGAAIRSPPPRDALSFAKTSRTFPSVFLRLPSPKVFGHTPLVVTRAKNYSAHDIPAFLAAVEFAADEEVARYRTRALPVTLSLRAPGVPVTCVNGVGTPTAEMLVYGDGGFGVAPRVVHGDGDGDGLVNLVDVLALSKVVGDDPDQPYFKSVLVPNATHTGIISDDAALQRVMNEILEANSHSVYH